MRLPPSSSSALGSAAHARAAPAGLDDASDSHRETVTAPLSDHARRVDGDVDDRRGRAAGRRPAVEHEVERVAEVGENGAGGRRRYPKVLTSE